MEKSCALLNSGRILPEYRKEVMKMTNEQRIEILRNKCAHLTKDNLEKAVQIADLQDELGSARREYTDMRNILHRERDYSAQLTEKVEKLQAERDKLDNLCNTQSECIDSMIDDMEDLRKQNTYLEGVKARSEKDIAELTEIIDDWNAIVDDFEYKMKRLNELCIRYQNVGEELRELAVNESTRDMGRWMLRSAATILQIIE